MSDSGAGSGDASGSGNGSGSGSMDGENSAPIDSGSGGSETRQSGSGSAGDGSASGGHESAASASDGGSGAAAADLAEVAFENGQLSLVGQDLEVLPSWMAERYAANTVAIDASYNCLRTLNGLGAFTNITSLILDNNDLVAESGFPALPALDTLSLNNNAIEDIEELLGLINANYPALRFLSLLKNPCCPSPIFQSEKDEGDYRRYRYYVIYKLDAPLRFLDSSEISDDERGEAGRVGKFTVVARPSRAGPSGAGNDGGSGSGSAEGSQDGSADDETGALPEGLQEVGTGGAKFGVTKYVYYGRQSEGNRFITNGEL